MAGVGKQSQSYHLINDFDFLHPANENILQNSLNQTKIKEQSDNLMDLNKSNRTIFKLHKGRGAKHIQIHLDENSEGQITIEELLNLGNSIRTYLSIFKEPFIDNRDAKIYEWQNNNGVRFRAVIAEIGGGTNLPSHTNSNEQIITFYFDRNLKQYKGYDRMKFQNPQVEKYYINQTKKGDNK